MMIKRETSLHFQCYTNGVCPQKIPSLVRFLPCYSPISSCLKNIINIMSFVYLFGFTVYYGGLEAIQ
jgi:hypothetical protein